VEIPCKNGLLLRCFAVAWGHSAVLPPLPPRPVRPTPTATDRPDTVRKAG